MIEVQRIALGKMAANCYLMPVGGNHVIAVDIGDEPTIFLKILEKQNLVLDKILLTHGHCDHIGGVAAVQVATGVPVYIHEGDAEMLTNPDANLALWIQPEEIFQQITEQVVLVHEGDEIKAGDKTIQVLHTPGHSNGSVCYCCEDVMFSGDTLFRMAYGRTDLPDGSDIKMQESFHRLKHLEKNYRVYPGHMGETTLDFEQKNNPLMRCVR